MASISSSALSLLQAASYGGVSQNLLSALSGGAAGGTDPVAALVNAEKNQTKDIARQAKDPETKRDTDHYKAVLAKAKDIKALMADSIARKVLLTANGLGDQTDSVALATKVLQSDTKQPGNLASKLSDPRWLTMAKTYDVAHQGLSFLKRPDAVAAIISGYAEVQWQASLETTTPGLSAAIDFRNRATSIKNVDQILGDANFRKVVTTALGIPQQIAFQPLGTQEKAITDRLDVTKLKDPKFVEQFARRFLIANANNTNTSLFG